MAFKLIESDRPAGVLSTPRTWSLVRAGAQFETTDSSNGPTNQEVISKSHDTPIHRS